MSHLYFNEESNYSEEITCDNEVFRATILHHRKKLCAHCKNEGREIDCLYCREMDAYCLS